MRNLGIGFLILAASLAGLWADDGWSEPVNGLRARLEVLPPVAGGGHFCRLYLDLQNVANTMGCRKIAFSPQCVRLRLTDVAGKPVPTDAQISYDGLEPFWEPLVLPFDGLLRFQFGGHGLEVLPDASRIIDLGPMQSWVIRRADPARFLEGTLTIPRTPGSHPYLEWSGTLVLPRVPVPTE